MVIIKWHGHACVELKKSDGFTIVIDPHDGLSIGLKKPDVKADLILVTHDHFDHNAVNIVAKENSRILKAFYGEVEIDDIKINGFKTFHDKFMGRRRGLNAVYVVNIEDKRIAHLGDLGHIPESELLSILSGIDLLIIPVGGTYTIYPDEAWKIVELTNPVNIMPIHYWIPGLNLPLSSIDEFLMHVKKYRVVRLETNYFNLDDHSGDVIIPKYID